MSKGARRAVLTILSMLSAPAAGLSGFQAPAVGPAAAASPGPGYSPQEIEELRTALKRLIGCWYRALDEACFWDMAAADSPWMQRHRNILFKIVFSEGGTPDPRTLSIDAEYQARKLRERGIGCLNDEVQDGFCLVPGSRLYESERRQQENWDEEDREEWQAFYPPPTDDFLVAIYEITGDGYWDGMMVLNWVRRNGSWKLYSFMGSD